MSAGLAFQVTTPAAVLVDDKDVDAVRAEDASGSFGVLPGMADLLTVLPASVLRWRTAAGALRYCAVGGGVLTVSGGRLVTVACRQGRVGDDLGRLVADVERMREEEAEAARSARVEQARLHAEAVRHLMRHLRTDAMPDGLSP